MKHFLKAFVPAALLVGAVVAGLYYSGYRIERYSLQEEQRQWVALAQEAVARDFESVGSDLRVLAESLLPPQAPAQLSALDWQRIAQAVGSFAKYKRLYSRVSYFDYGGGKAFAVDYSEGDVSVATGGEVEPAVGPALLARARELEPPAAVVSRLQVTPGPEGEFTATIRFATPVVDAQGRVRGVLVLTYLGTRLIEHLRSFEPPAHGLEMLVTANGTWLHAAADGGAILGPVEGPFDQLRPAAWKQLVAAETGQFHTARGLYTYQTVEPQRELARRVDIQVVQATAGDPFWKVISFLDEGHLAALRKDRVNGAMALYALLLVPIGIGSAYVGRLGHRHEEARAELRQLGRAVEQSADLIAISDCSQRVSYINRSFSRISGYPPEAICGRPAAILWARAPDEERIAALWERACAGEAVEEVVTTCTRDGSQIVLDLSLSPLKDARGRNLGHLLSAKDITHQVEAERRLERLAFHHPLTGLPNRQLFHERLIDAAARAKRQRHRLAVLFLDLDRFKQINDSLGHKAGDEVIRQVAQRLPAQVRATDTVAHLGGDEFTILLDDVHRAAEVVRVSSKILEAFAKPFRIDGQDLYVSTSVGIAMYPQDTDSVERLIEDADTAMYHAKREGRNRLQFYSASMTNEANRRLQLETQLRDAMQRPDFVLHYQPVVEPRSGKLLAVEALLRWQREDASITLPSAFVPALEESGLIVPVTGWVLSEASKACRRLRERYPDLAMHVNVSARTVHHGDLTRRVRQALRSVRLAPEALVLEITEGVLLDDRERVRRTLRELQEMQIGVAIDDFGTGYSSLAYLKTIPARALKIDQSFVRGVGTDPRDAAMVSAILAMAEELDLDVVAEGVENEAQLEFLRQRRCHGVQGFLVGRPQPLEALLAAGGG